MAFNKNKALESALKYLNQGKVAQAIGEYQQILRQDPKDQATLMTVGDLYARQGDMSQAVEYFERLAQVYLSDGFNSKAIAIYKKIAKLAPAELAPLERLADLYVQQGVLSEARPLYLQIAEAHLKANRSQKAVEVLHRLLEVEPENPRVQMRLAELYNVMGQKKEAAQTYLNYAQRLFERGDNEEAHKLADRALEVDSSNALALMLKAKILVALKKGEQAVKILETHPEAETGGDVTSLILDLELEAGHTKHAADRGRKQLARGHAHHPHLHKVADSLIEQGQTEEALDLLRELREPMIEAGEQDKFLKSLTSCTERSPDQIEALEMVLDFSRHTSDPFRVNSALGQLADAYANKGNFARALELLEELVDRNKNDERLVERLNQMRARASGTSTDAATSSHAAATPTAPAAPAPQEAEASEPHPEAVPEETVKFAEHSEAAPAAAVSVDEGLDEETQRYVAQALTDVDLFSSYGLTQKATHLLENVLQRAPRHTPTLERLLDLYLGAGNERRTAETASILEQIHRERNDSVNADRFAELRQRFQKVAGISEDELPTAPPAPVAAAPAASAAAEPHAEVSAPATPEIERHMPTTARRVAHAPSAEFEIAAAPPEPEPAEEIPAAPVAAAPAAPHAPAPPAPEQPQAAAATEEVDLSDEWEAMVQEVSEDAPAPAAEPEPEPEPVAQEPEAEPAHAAPSAKPEPEPEPVAFEIEEVQEAPAQPEPEPEPEPAAEEVLELVDETAAEPEPAAAAGSADFELELTPQPPHAQKTGPLTTEDFISELVSEIDDLDQPAAAPPAAPVASAPAASTAHRTPPAAKAPVAPPPPVTQEPVPAPTAESLNQLAEVFQEFRSELGELGDEDEDLETHYNLGIAYREMGLYDEAIGEFQKVAKAIQNGKPFAYAMNCATLLALTFMDKGEPKIASLWYQRALDTPGVDQESTLALRYDLGVALESAGESRSALDSFQQVYAVNIDYRDVADRIAALQKHESHV
ncbi:MAG TPA: tetratricopeptide repeat protein [Candidatus Limnocylindrales bacterium]|nr:tetratricopeptide repeat protein [Candidatus Limnocylindrales bacterium]